MTCDHHPDVLTLENARRLALSTGCQEGSLLHQKRIRDAYKTLAGGCYPVSLKQCLADMNAAIAAREAKECRQLNP